MKHHRIVVNDPNGSSGATNDAKSRRPSTIADHVVMHSPVHAPILAKTRHSSFSRTTDCVSATLQITPSSCNDQKTFSDIVEDLSESRNPLPTCSTGNVMNSSIDEGVELEFTGDRDSLCSNASIFSYSTVASGGSCGSPGTSGIKTTGSITSSSGDASSCSGLSRGGALSDIVSLCGSIEVSNQSVSSGSPFTSFDSNVESEFMWNAAMAGRQSSIASYSGAPAVTASPPPTMVTEDTSDCDFGNNRPNGCAVDDIDDCRRTSRSPVNFREGRRASDGLMSQGIFAFRQKLCETTKIKGIAALRVDTDNPQTQCSASNADEDRGTVSHQEKPLHFQWNDDMAERSRVTSKRRSLPCAETARVAPYHTESPLRSGDGAHGLGCDQSVLRTLQQQLMTYRLQHKRQLFQRHALQPASGSAAMALYQQFQQLDIDVTAARRLPPLHELQHPIGTSLTVNEEMELTSSSVSLDHLESATKQEISPALSTANSSDQSLDVSSLASAHSPCLVMQRRILRQASYKLAQQQPSVLDSDRSLRHQLSGDPLPLSPMFEEVSEDDDELSRPACHKTQSRDDSMDT